MSVELFKVKQYSKTSKGFEFLKLTAKRKVLQNLKMSWKKSLKVMEFEELKRVQTLSSDMSRNVNEKLLKVSMNIKKCTKVSGRALHLCKKAHCGLVALVQECTLMR